MRFAVYGAGSLGIVLLAKLRKETGNEITVIDRNPKSVSAINTNGAIVVGKLQLKEKVTAILDTEVTLKYDIIFLMTKQLGNTETVKKISKFLADDGVICTMQNGLPEQGISEIIGVDRTYGCTVNWGATRLEPGVSELTSEPNRESLTFCVGSYSGKRTKYLEEISRILNIVGDVTVDDNFIGMRWSKLLINSAFSGMSCVCGSTFGEIADNEKSRHVIQRIVKECIDVAKAANINIEPVQGKNIASLFDYSNPLKKALAYMLIPFAIKSHRSLIASMLQDVEKGIPCEIDSINGIVCEFGKKYNCPTPFNDKVVEIVHQFETKELVPSMSNAEKFDELLNAHEDLPLTGRKLMFFFIAFFGLFVILMIARRF